MHDPVRLVLTGELQPGVSLETAAGNLATLLKIDVDRAHQLLGAAPKIIKPSVSGREAGAYLTHLKRAGVVVRAEPLTPPAGEARQQAIVSDDLDIASLNVEPVATPVIENGIACPACGRQQPPRTLCLGCGIDMPRFRAAQQTPASPPAVAAQDTHRNVTTTPQLTGRVPDDELEFLTPPLLGVFTDGRLGRMRYLAYSMALLVVIVAAAILGSPLLVFLDGFIYAFAAGALWLMLRLAILRLHDFDFSGWWCVSAVAIPGIAYAIDLRLGMLLSGAVLLASLGLCLVPGDTADNRFGLPAEPPTLLIHIGGVLCLLISVASLPAALKSTGTRNAIAEHSQPDNTTQDGENGQKIYDNHGREITDARIHELGEKLRATGVNISDAELRAKLLQKQAERDSDDD
ncbi:DUF805 domain-containing protein [Jeongeupia naejangsanensis]|uniref:DUF805 domain-containing protein n=1 Tax=Jeongeupia naejangsanensis TaxID=613195 RepID=A0ABS2BK03_9NEIS|nr:DUF805 domain-containing protein [Jeongeupia naejangsanensis]MBM3115936.1 DUF805 domain-containing protein [Jeongeupia naejangsanensis]